MTGVWTDLSRGARRRLLTCLIVMALALPGPARADAAGDMFGFMFRMMLTMMNVMSSAVNNNSGGWPGSVNPFGSGATTWPLMSSMYGMSDWPGSGFGSSPWNTPWTGLQNPYSRGWYNPRGRPPFPYNTGAVLLEGSWYGTTGDILTIRANRFSLRNGLVVLNGKIKLHNNILTLYTPQTNSVQVYTFARNLTDLVLQDRHGKILRFRKYPGRFGNRLHTYRR